MRRWLPIAAAAVLTAALMGPATFAGAQSDGETFSVVSTIVRVQEVDVGPSGPSPGDSILFKDTLWNEARTQRVGVDWGECTSNFGSAVLCDVAFRINGRGQLAASGKSTFTAQRFNFPIVGGTADFRDVTGQVHVEFTSQDTALLTFQLHGTT